MSSNRAEDQSDEAIADFEEAGQMSPLNGSDIDAKEPEQAEPKEPEQSAYATFGENTVVEVEKQSAQGRESKTQK
jgi:hypothetical protein